ncbi:hypothetical protein RHMOL_Rhmol09G0239300 [Rhododendron molle]|uniref:Uncharacterized protein n=1 Tax=Rhododendron molle TaxID=49168 RepID=A0ACC0MHU9_RHOML|nr:hypothetical protein RHMOL_Rhmol09G0239300 [Rhododendron molle]
MPTTITHQIWSTQTGTESNGGNPPVEDNGKTEAKNGKPLTPTTHLIKLAAGPRTADLETKEEDWARGATIRQRSRPEEPSPPSAIWRP